MTYQREENGPLIREIRLRNLLSYGPETEPLRLDRLNVLIGPNGSGKSNLIEAISLLRAAPNDIRSVIREGGGVGEWIWKGSPGQTASIEVLVSNPQGQQPLRHVLAFREERLGFRVDDERIENERPYDDHPDTYFYYRFQRGQPIVNTPTELGRKLARESVSPDLSILAQLRHPEDYPVFAYLADSYEKFRIYREWQFGRKSVFDSCSNPRPLRRPRRL